MIWRTGRKVGRTIYEQHGPEPSGSDRLIGLMDTPGLADMVVRSLNATAAGGTTPTAEPAAERHEFEPQWDFTSCALPESQGLCDCDVRALCDALDRQREEIKRLHRAWAEKVRGYDEEIDRQREEIARLRAWPSIAKTFEREWDDARARLAEARALCDEVERDYGKGTDFDIHGCAMISVRRLRAILDRPLHQGAERAEPQA